MYVNYTRVPLIFFEIHNNLLFLLTVNIVLMPCVVLLHVDTGALTFTGFFFLGPRLGFTVVPVSARSANNPLLYSLW